MTMEHTETRHESTAQVCDFIHGYAFKSFHNQPRSTVSRCLCSNQKRILTAFLSTQIRLCLAPANLYGRHPRIRQIIKYLPEPFAQPHCSLREIVEGDGCRPLFEEIPETMEQFCKILQIPPLQKLKFLQFLPLQAGFAHRLMESLENLRMFFNEIRGDVHGNNRNMRTSREILAPALESERLGVRRTEERAQRIRIAHHRFREEMPGKEHVHMLTFIGDEKPNECFAFRDIPKTRRAPPALRILGSERSEGAVELHGHSRSPVSPAPVEDVLGFHLRESGRESFRSIGAVCPVGVHQRFKLCCSFLIASCNESCPLFSGNRERLLSPRRTSGRPFPGITGMFLPHGFREEGGDCV